MNLSFLERVVDESSGVGFPHTEPVASRKNLNVG